MEYETSSDLSRVIRRWSRWIEPLGGKVPVVDMGQQGYDELLKTIRKADADIEKYIDAQFQGLDNNNKCKVTLRQLASNNAVKKYKKYKESELKVEEDYVKQARFFNCRVRYEAANRGTSVQEVIGDPNTCFLPAWYRVINTDDPQVVKDYGQAAEEVLMSKSFKNVKERIPSADSR
jgi:hypothetical protein